MTNFERIKAMSIEEMAESMLFFAPTVLEKPMHTGLSGKYTDTAEQTVELNAEWLQQEVIP